jgi:hypothetical protein
MAKKGSQKEIKIGDKKYILQHPGIKYCVKMRDTAKSATGVLMEEKYFEQMMEHVIFTEEGKRTDWDYWDENEGFDEVLKEAINFCI